MPRIMDPVLSMVHERANPQTCYFTEVNAPDVARVLRRAEDEFLQPVSQTPASSITADPAGALTMASTALQVANFPVDDDASVNLNVSNPSPKDFRGLRWGIVSTFGRAVLKTFTAKIRRAGLEKNDLALQIYRLQGEPAEGVTQRVVVLGVVGTSAPSFAIKWSFIPLLHQPAIWKHNEAAYSAGKAFVTFDLTKDHFEFGRSNAPVANFDQAGEDQAYYFVITPLGQSSNDTYFWERDRTTSRTVAGIGSFQDIWWRRNNDTDPYGWALEIDGHNGYVANAVPTCSVSIENYAATAQAIYALTLPATPQAASVGSVVFEAGLPTGTAATFELSTAGSGGPWTVMKHGDVVTTKQQTYHARVTMTSNAPHRLAPKVAALGVEFKIPVDLTAEAIVEPIAHEVEVPFLKASVGEGRATAVRFGLRNYRDKASDLASLYPSSKLEVDVYLGSRHPFATRDTWLHLDRAMVNDRDPSPTAEALGILSYSKNLKRKIPKNIESINTVLTVASATTTAITFASNLPDAADGYTDKHYYIRVRQSSQTGFAAGSYSREIDGLNDPSDLGTPPRTIHFDAATPLPGTLAAGDKVEIHSASYLAQGLRWEDADPADAWLEILNVQLLIPLERIGRGDLGQVGRSGYPPRVTDRSSDPAIQALLKVTLQTKEPESADELIDQLSFIMGGVTTEIGGQIVFRQVYPLRDATGQIVVPAEPVAATFDSRNMAGLTTPTGLQQRIAQISCNYGINTTAVSEDTQAAQTAIGIDGDALAWLDDQSVDDLAPATIPDEIARWCYNSVDGGLYLATQLVQQIVRATSTGQRVWSWTATKSQPRLVIGDRVAVITDQYTDYDPARKVAIRGWWAYQLALVSVQAGGTRFRGFMLGLADAIQVKAGEGELPIDEDLDKTEILSVSPHDSADGKQAIYDVVAGSAVQFLDVHHRLWPIGTIGNPYDFSQAQTVIDTREFMRVRPDPIDGHFRFTIDHPTRGFQIPVLLVARQGPPAFAPGRGVFKIMLDPAPSLMSAKIKVAVTNAIATLTIDVTASVSDWPVKVDVFEGAPDSTAILTKTLSAAATLTSITDPVLGNIGLPNRELKYWWVRLTNVAFEEEWFGPQSANRDPLPEGKVTVDQYRAEPVFRMVFDTDTDSIRVTVPDGRTKTWNSAALAALGGPAIYVVGDVLDDASTESDLGVDEERGPYKVEYQGGGTWVTLFGPAAVLHGTPSNPPNATMRVVKSANRDTEDLYITPDSPVGENLTVYYRDGELSTSPTYRLVVSAGDSTPLFVSRLTEVGPANFFKNVDGTGSPSAKLSAIPLTAEQVKRVTIGIEGEQSGVQIWLPWALSMKEKPWNESFELVWDNASGKLRAIVVAGANTAFETVQVADNDAFTSPSTQTGTVAVGGTLTKEFALSGAQRGKTWYGRAIPNNLASGAGLPGDASTASVAVPALFTYTVAIDESAGTGTVTLVVTDPGGVLHVASPAAITWEVLNNGTKLVQDSTTTPSPATTGTYTKTITLDEKHPIQLSASAHFVDGSTEFLGAWTFDANKVSDVKATVAYSGSTATITATFDTDTVTGVAGGARYRIDGGSWINLTVNASTLIASFTVTASTSAKQVVDVQGKNTIDGNYGNAVTVEVDRYRTGPSITASFERLTATTGRVIWSATGTVTLSIDVGTPATPGASPIAITPLDTSTHQYEFVVTADGQTVSKLVWVPQAVPSAVIERVYTFTLYSSTATTVPVFVDYSGALNGGSIEVLVIRTTGSTPDLNGTPTSLGSSSGSSPITVTDNRPAGAGTFVYNYIARVKDSAGVVTDAYIDQLGRVFTWTT
jgi:hypothetical protein